MQKRQLGEWPGTLVTVPLAAGCPISQLRAWLYTVTGGVSKILVVPAEIISG